MSDSPDFPVDMVSDALPPPKSSSELQVKLEVFEGPLDLLLYLIKKDEVDIYDIPIVTVTQQYLTFINTMKMLDLEIAGEFIVMAATLMMIKSRMLLPEDVRPDAEEEEESDPRWDLVRQLLEYKKFKDAALHLEKLEERQSFVLDPEGEDAPLEKDASLSMRDVSIFDLIDTFNQILSRVKQEELKEIFAERFTVADKVDQILMLVQRGEQRLTLHRLFDGMTSRREMICTFLAILELMKMKHVRAVQEQQHGDIAIVAADPDEARPAADGAELPLEPVSAGLDYAGEDAPATTDANPNPEPSHE
jgi:segregation and condensation protein A